MSGISLEIMEKYVLSEEKREALESVTPFTEQYYYIELMMELNTGKDVELLEKRIEDFCSNLSFNAESRRILQMKYLLACLKTDLGEEKQKKVLEELNKKYLNLSFDHMRPQKIEMDNQLVAEENKNLRNELSQEEKNSLSEDYYLEYFYENQTEANLNKINPQYLPKLELKKIKTQNENLIRNLLSKKVNWFNSSEITWFLTELSMNSLMHRVLEEQLVTVCFSLYLDQMEELRKLDYFQNKLAFYNIYFEMKFPKNYKTKAEEKEYLKSCLDFLEQQPLKYRCTASWFRNRLLALNLDLNEIEEKEFLTYLKSPIDADYQFLKVELKNELYQRSTKEGWAPLNNRPSPQSQLVHTYLSEVLKSADGYSSYLEFFDEVDLKKMYFTIKLRQGENVVNVNNIFTDAELKSINEEKLLKFDKNKDTFAPNEKVELNLSVKNIKSLKVRVFEVNTENYLLQNINGDFNDIKVESLIPFEEYVYSFSQPAMNVHSESLEFPSITNKSRGVFIVDLIGEELNSKAILKKGNLTLVYDKITGRNCVIVDEKNEVCKSERTGLYIQNKFFRGDAYGVIRIPQQVENFAGDVIVVHEHFASKSRLELQSMNFEMKTNLIYNSESFMPGHQTKLILQNRLFCNNRTASLSLLKNAELTLVTTNCSGIEQKQVIKDLRLSDHEDLVADFRVPSKMENLLVLFTAEVDNSPETRKIDSSVNLSFQRRKLENKIDMALKKNSNNEFIIEVFGINGEPITNEKAHLNFYIAQENKSFELVTDNKGRLCLGHLKDVKSVNLELQGAYFVFDLTHFSKKFYYPENIILVENETLTFPLTKSPHQTCRLFQYQSPYYTSDMAQKLDLSDNNLKLSNLCKGTFHLFIGESKIVLDVHEGKKVELNGTNIINEDYWLAIEERKNPLVVSKESHPDNYILNLHGEAHHVKIHLMSSTYRERIHNTAPIYSENTCNLKFDKKGTNNRFYSGAKIHDELIYVYNRKNKNTYLGNTLDKPGLILKRNKLNETLEVKETLSSGRGFENQDLCYEDDCRAYDRCQKEMFYDNYCDSINRCVDNRIVLREFFKNPGLIMSNLRPENNQLVVSKSLFDKHSSVYAIVTTNDTQIVVEMDNNDREFEKIDLILEKSKKKGFVYRYNRSMKYLQSGENYTIPHVERQEYCFIEDVKTFYDSILVVSSESSKLEEWRFVSQWNQMTPEDKLKKYDKFTSHELNLFLKFKDPEFFEGVVKTFISNKKEKTLVDYYLLDDSENLKSFSSLSNLNELSPLECILLVDGLKFTHRHISESIKNLLEMKSKLNKVSEDDYKKKFDSLLSSQKQDDGDQIAPVPLNMFMAQNIAPSSSNMMNYAPQQKLGAPVRLMKSMARNRGENLYNLNNMNYEEKAFKRAEIFTPLQGTVEYNEKKFYFNYVNKLYKVEKFWVDLASHVLEKESMRGFFSDQFLLSSENATEALVILSFTDLNFEKKNFESQLVNNDLVLDSQSNMICLTKEIVDTLGENADMELMIAQRFYDPNDKFRLNELENVNYEKPVKEFVKGVIYESNIIVTNSTSTPMNVDLLFEIPQGAISVYSLDTMQIKKVLLEPLNSHLTSFYFYFPQSGKFNIYPATVVKENQILGFAQIHEEIEVKENKTIRDMDSISDIVSTGNIEKIISFIEDKNILNPQLFNFNDIYWLLKMKPFYEKLIPILRKKGVYDFTVWSYSVFHNDLDTLRELFLSNNIKHKFWDLRYICTDLMKIDKFEIKEYYPLVNPRVHSLKQKENILNESFRKTYTELMTYLFQKGKMTTEDKLITINYLICQDRMEEAIKLHSSISLEETQKTECKIQSDYLSAYIDFINGYPDFKVAKEICGRYLTFPVLTWRNLFVEIANQLAEFEETDLIEDILKKEKETKKNSEKAKTQSNLSCELVQNQIKIVHENISSVVVNCYKIDLEVHFSMNAFNKSSIRDYTMVKPFNQEIVQIPQNDKPYYMYNIPENISRENLFIEISCLDEGLSKSQYIEYLPFTLNHHLNKEFGIIKLFDENTKKPVPKIYMKCFAKYKNGQVLFYKDGYTDLRGSFDYVSLNKDNLDDIALFRILIVSSEFGSKIVETEPPIKIGRIEGEAKKIISKNWVGIQKQTAHSKNSTNAYQQVCF